MFVSLRKFFTSLFLLLEQPFITVMSIHIEYLEICTHFVTVHVMLISTYSFIFFKALDVQ
jgi:hypothetical protein